MKYPARMGVAVQEDGRVIPAVLSYKGRELGAKKDPKNDGRRYAKLSRKQRPSFGGLPHDSVDQIGEQRSSND